MAINTNEEDVAGAPKSEKPSFGASFGASPTPAGTNDLIQLINATSARRIDPSIEPYLTEVMRIVEASLDNCTLVPLDRIINSYVIQHVSANGKYNLFGLYFVQVGDVISAEFIPPSVRLRTMQQEIRDKYEGKQVRLINAVMPLSGYKPDMDRAFQMANSIIRSFIFESKSEYRNTNIDALRGNEFVVNWDIAQASSVERQLSASGIPPRMDIGCVVRVKVKDPNNLNVNNYEDQYVPIGVVGGYVDFRDKEPVTIHDRQFVLYRPVIYITVLNSVFPVAGIGSILLATFADGVLNSSRWSSQWTLADGTPNPGMLEEDPEKRGFPVVIKDREELASFIRNRCAPPQIALQLQDGNSIMPEMIRLVSEDPQYRATFLDRVASFFNDARDANVTIELARRLETRFEGVYGDDRGVLYDSRDIDYLKIAAVGGFSMFDLETRRLLLGTDVNPTDRARLVSKFTKTFTPINLTTSYVINRQFLQWVVQRAQNSGLRIIDPDSRLESRPFGSYLEGFDVNSNIGSFVSSTPQKAGLNLSPFFV